MAQLRIDTEREARVEVSEKMAIINSDYSLFEMASPPAFQNKFRIISHPIHKIQRIHLRLSINIT